MLKRDVRGSVLLLAVLPLCWLLFFHAPLHAAEAPPDKLTLNVGTVENVGTDVTLVLTKRSMRSADYVCGIWSDDGFKKIPSFPVRTYRGHVQGDPGMRVNASIEPDGKLNANIGVGKDHIAKIRDLRADIGKSVETTCTPFGSTGNKIVPLKSLHRRKLPTPSGCLVPQVPMRQSKWSIYVPKSYTEQYKMEKVVARVEQRWNDADFTFARDVGTAWEIGLLVLEDPKSTKRPDREALHAMGSAVEGIAMHASVTGVDGRNNGKGNSLNVSGDLLEGRILLHEGAHLYGDWCHQMDPRDGLFGGGAFFGRNNVQIMVGVTMDPEAFCHRGEDTYPGVIYNGVLPPSAMRDMANTHKDTPVTIDVLENDYDGNNDALSLQAVTPRSVKGGTVVVHKDGRRAVYTPPPGFLGLDQFTYTVVDSNGAANKTGLVKVDVRTDGPAVHCTFEDAEKDSIEWMRKAKDWRMWNYDTMDQRPESEKLTYHFPNHGPYDGGRATAHWLDYAPVKGLRGKGLLNPVGGDRKAQVDLTEAGDPGRESLSVSVWALYPQAADGGIILCKSPYGGKTLPCGWAIRRYKDPVPRDQRNNKDYVPKEGFSFFGNTVRVSLKGRRNFEVHSEEPIQTNTWYHLVMVMDREAKKLRAYVNNKEVTASKTSSTIPDEVIEYHAPLRLFNGLGWKSWRAAPMLVDEVKIFTSALTPKQVAELYAEGKDAEVPKLPSVPADAQKP